MAAEENKYPGKLLPKEEYKKNTNQPGRSIEALIILRLTFNMVFFKEIYQSLAKIFYLITIHLIEEKSLVNKYFSKITQVHIVLKRCKPKIFLVMKSIGNTLESLFFKINKKN